MSITDNKSRAYTMRNAPLPTITVLPDNRIDKKKSSINHNKNVKQMAELVKLMEKKKFWVEVAVLDRLHYKYINAQRLFPRFRIVAQVRKAREKIDLLLVLFLNHISYIIIIIRRVN